MADWSGTTEDRADDWTTIKVVEETSPSSPSPPTPPLSPPIPRPQTPPRKPKVEPSPSVTIDLDLDPTVVIIDTPTQLASFLSDIVSRALPSTSLYPTIFVDIEGVDLCRDGQLCIIQMYIPPLDKTVFLIDVHTLGELAFTTQASSSTEENPITLAHILQDPNISKCLYDVRNDSDALYNLYHINMPSSSIIDLQLMELATRKRSKKHLSGLRKAVDKDLPLDEEQRTRWSELKKKGKDMFEGDPNIASKRPIPSDFLQYCVQDVLVLPLLFTMYDSKLTNKWRAKVQNEVFWRLQLAKQEMYYGKNGNMHLGPW